MKTLPEKLLDLAERVYAYLCEVEEASARELAETFQETEVVVRSVMTSAYGSVQERALADGRLLVYPTTPDLDDGEWRYVIATGPQHVDFVNRQAVHLHRTSSPLTDRLSATVAWVERWYEEAAPYARTEAGIIVKNQRRIERLVQDVVDTCNENIQLVQLGMQTRREAERERRRRST